MLLIYFILLIYFFFIIWLLDGYKNLIKEPNLNTSYRPFVSVVIAARNEAENIPHLLNYLTNQTYPKNLYEIIIVNDRSLDNSKNMLEKYENKIENLKVITINNCPSIERLTVLASENPLQSEKSNVSISGSITTPSSI